MAHAEAEADEGLPGQDSFLDIVANMVGILIILVMVVGVRASHVAVAGSDDQAAEQAASGEDAELLQQQLEQSVRDALDQRRQIEAKLARAINIRRETELADAKRLELTVVRSQVESEITRRRSELGKDKQEDFDVQRQIAAKQLEINELTKEQLGLLSQPEEVEEIESVPTPLAKEVTGEEIHVRLKNGLLAVVPVKPLLAEVERRGLDYLRNGLRNNNSAADVYGPIGGFRMKLYLEVLDEAALSPRSTGGGRRTMVQVGEFLPTADDLGQPVEQAMMSNSSLMQLLTGRRTAAPALVVWVYPDSYDELGVIKRSMWEQRIPLAVRPLETEQRITFSSHGTRSSAQ